LAVVLITLGIIGIIAALTIPALLASHQKNVAAVRLKKFSAMWQQVSQTNAAEGISHMDFCPIYSAYFNPDAMLEFFDYHFAPYVKTVETVKMQRGIRAAFPDGSGIYLSKSYPTPSYEPNNCGFLMGIVFCPDYKACKTYDEMSLTQYGYSPKVDNKNTFLFYVNGSPAPTALSRDELVAACQTAVQQGFSYSHSCIQLIRHDGWEIKDDYPW
jgi:hypothetical protein